MQLARIAILPAADLRHHLSPAVSEPDDGTSIRVCRARSAPRAYGHILLHVIEDGRTADWSDTQACMPPATSCCIPSALHVYSASAACCHSCGARCRCVHTHIVSKKTIAASFIYS